MKRWASVPDKRPNVPGRYVAVPLALLEALAPPEPINQDERGGCVWCGKAVGRRGYGYATADLKDHEDDCPWIEVRRLVDA